MAGQTETRWVSAFDHPWSNRKAGQAEARCVSTFDQCWSKQPDTLGQYRALCSSARYLSAGHRMDRKGGEHTLWQEQSLRALRDQMHETAFLAQGVRRLWLLVFDFGGVTWRDELASLCQLLCGQPFGSLHRLS